jgi:nucleotide-binding universal stress UspA family protein
MMNKRVVVAVDLQEPMPWAVQYALGLAGRLQTPLTLLAVATDTKRGKKVAANLAGGNLAAGQRQWLDQTMEQGREAGVNLELFLAAGPFPQAILEFVGSRTDIQFLVIGVGGAASPATGLQPGLPLSRLHQIFTGEILLVREQGRITNLSEMPIKTKGRES